MAYELLPLEEAIAVGFGSRQLHIMIGPRFVFRRATHFYDLRVVRTLEHTVTYMRWLQYAIAGFQYERRTLIFVHYPYPASVTVNHLKIDSMVMHVVRHRTTVRNADVRRNESATAAIGNQVTVLHAGPPGPPFVIIGMLQDRVLLQAYANTVS